MQRADRGRDARDASPEKPGKVGNAGKADKRETREGKTRDGKKREGEKQEGDKQEQEKGSRGRKGSRGSKAGKGERAGKDSRKSRAGKESSAGKRGKVKEEGSRQAPQPEESRYPMADPAQLPDDIRERILAVQAKSGFVPNVFLKLALRPAEFRAFFAYHDALMLKEGALSKAEREMIVVATSALNQCLYCVVAHGAILRIYQKDPLIADQLATNYRKASLTPRQRAMLDFACKVAAASATIDDDDHRVLGDHGFDAEAAWDIAAIAAFFALSNRMANFSAMMPNEEFYLLGRVKPAKAPADPG